MYKVGQHIIYGFEGVCRVEKIGPVEIKGAQKNVDYYTLAPVYQNGKLYVPVESTAYSRPVISREEARALVEDIPNIPYEIFESSNPRTLTEHYQPLLKSNDCRELLRLLRSIYAKKQKGAEKGLRLGQVDERCFKQAEEKLYGELAVALDIPIQDVRQFITDVLEG